MALLALEAEEVEADDPIVSSPKEYLLKAKAQHVPVTKTAVALPLILCSPLILLGERPSTALVSIVPTLKLPYHQPLTTSVIGRISGRAN